MTFFSGTKKIEERLSRLRLRTQPKVQDAVARYFLEPQFRRKARPTQIEIEGWERIPNQGGCFIVMNHTDRFNYFPLQVALWRKQYPYTVTWVKAKYFENPVVAAFLESTNNIPVPSRNYVLAKDFIAHFGRKPSDEEFVELIRLSQAGVTRSGVGGVEDRGDARSDVAGTRHGASGAGAHGGGVGVRADFKKFLALNWELGSFAASVELRLARMLNQVVAHTSTALCDGLFVIVFPEGTRSKRLGRGKTGVAQVLLSLGVDYLPVGCNGSDLVFPGDVPWSAGGKILYRVGARQTVSLIPGVVPFSSLAGAHGPEFEAMTVKIMREINSLLDEDYQYDEANAGTNDPSSHKRDRFI